MRFFDHSKGLLGPKKELWDILQTVEKLDAEAHDLTSSIRDLPTVRYAYNYDANLAKNPYFRQF